MTVTRRPVESGRDHSLIYYDQRIRLEGYDIERTMGAAGMNAQVILHTPEVAARTSREESQG